MKMLEFVKNHRVRVGSSHRLTTAMNKTTRKFFGKAQGLSLNQKDKDVLLSEMRSFMQDNPAGENSAFVIEPPIKKGIFSEIFRVRLLPLVASLVLVFSIATPMYAAESSLPGEILYAIKVGINEQLRSFFNFSPTSKALWEIRLAERRLGEASMLIEKGGLSAKESEDLLEKLKANMASVEKHLKTVAGSEK
jgi:hypothetical protein